jgi:hypothetical protein
MLKAYKLGIKTIFKYLENTFSIYFSQTGYG